MTGEHRIPSDERHRIEAGEHLFGGDDGPADREAAADPDAAINWLRGMIAFGDREPMIRLRSLAKAYGVVRINEMREELAAEYRRSPVISANGRPRYNPTLDEIEQGLIESGDRSRQRDERDHLRLARELVDRVGGCELALTLQVAPAEVLGRLMQMSTEEIKAIAEGAKG